MKTTRKMVTSFRIVVLAVCMFGGISFACPQTYNLHREIYTIDKLKQNLRLLPVPAEEMYPVLSREENCVVVYSGEDDIRILYLEFPRTGIRIKFPRMSSEKTIEGDHYKNLDYMVMPTIYDHVQAKDSNLKFVRGLIQ